MDYIAYKIPQGEMHPQISGLVNLRYAENYYICSVPDINTISIGLIQKYGIVKANDQVVRGLEFFVAQEDSAKIYKGYSSGQSLEFFDEDFDTVKGIRIKRPMTDAEVTDRYEAIRWVRILMVKDYYKQKFETLTINKTPQERATWDTQVSEANAYILDNTVLTPTLSLIANAKGITVSELAPIVITASNNYKTEIAQIFAEEESYVSQLKNAVGNDIINVELPVPRTIIPGDTRFTEQTTSPSGS
jgi:hypothetical protein